jgi:hypothetical protein
VSIEPDLAAAVHRVDAAIVAPEWASYRLCPICKAAPGEACKSMFSAVRDGRPDGPPRVLNIAHGYRRRRAGR